MSVGSINSGISGMMMNGMKGMQRPDPSKMADQIFSKLDTKGQGYLEKGDLQAALDKVSTTTGQNNGNNSNSVDDMFSKLDGDGDGKVTKAELSASFEKIASQLDGPFPRMGMGGGGMPDMMPQTGSQGITENDNSKQISDLLNILDANDTERDGKANSNEAKAHEVSSSPKNTNDNSSSSGIDEKIMKQMMQLIHAYGGLENAGQSGSFSASV